MFTSTRQLAMLSGLTLLLSLGSAGAERPQPQKDTSLSPYFVVNGGEPGVDTMPLKSTRADARISGVIARVKVTQVYENTGKKPLEAIYVFPGSTRAAVFGMRMTIGDRVIVAKINKRDEARKIYEQAKAEGKSASLLEQQRPNVFQMNVANIMPGDTITVEMDYTELLVSEEGAYEFVYPAVVGPRYTEATEETAGSHDRFTKTPYQRKGEKPTYDWDISVQLAAGVAVQSFGSPSHRVDTRVEGSNAMARLADGETGGDADFVLRYGLRGKAVDSGMLLFEGEDENFFLTMVQPPASMDDVAMPKREYVFIVDVSGSMHGFPLDTARKVMDELLDGLQPHDRFNVMMFSGGSRVLAEQSVPATPEHIRTAREVLAGMQGGGGTQILPALKRALAMPAAPDMARSFIVVTDGYVSVEPEVFDLVRENLGEANLFAFGIGSSVNRHLIEGMARVGMGEPFIVLDSTQAEDMATRFQRYIAAPALTNIKVEFDGFDAYDVEPEAVPDLFAMRPVVVFGKYRGEPRGVVRVTGVTGSGRFEKELRVSHVRPSTSNEALRYLWARHRIARLSDLNNLRRDDKRIAEVTDLGLKYNLMTAYTSFVAVDETVRNVSGKHSTVKQPLPLPRGVDDRAVGTETATGGGFGRGGMMQRAQRGKMGFRQPVRPSPRPSADAPAAGEVAEAEEPRREDKDADKARPRILALDVTGPLSKADARRILTRRLNILQGCQAVGAGTFTLKIMVAADGKVTSVTIAKSHGTPAAGVCLTQRSSPLRFSAAGAASVIEVTLRLD